jgi:hypothetical protein
LRSGSSEPKNSHEGEKLLISKKPVPEHVPQNESTDDVPDIEVNRPK